MMDHAVLMSLPVEELQRRARIPFRLFADIPALLADFARTIADEIRRANEEDRAARLILPVGPVKQYPLLVEITNRERLSWRNVWVFQMDEFLDWQGRLIPEDHALSFTGFLKSELFAKIDPLLAMPPEQHVAPHPFRIDEFSEKLERVGGADCCFGGIGYHGHVAFNEPVISRWNRVSVEEMRQSLTRVLPLGDDSIVVQSIHSAGGDSQAIPPMAVTCGMRDILAARKIRLYCAGGTRHQAVFRVAVAGEVSAGYPVTLVQGHADAEVRTDAATAEPIEVGLR
ncbi:MAG: 6-phosphogluconolactonase [Candidatus Solibacter usitatus]|nr:6-phosphogluconolactonase [Candidatus Solibacter usitatus]